MVVGFDFGYIAIMADGRGTRLEKEIRTSFWQRHTSTRTIRRTTRPLPRNKTQLVLPGPAQEPVTGNQLRG
jgi:hypothetical protein